MKLNKELAKEIRKVALELPHGRFTVKEWEAAVELPRFQYLDDFKARALANGPISRLEANVIATEQVTWKMWQINFYEMVQFPQTRFFKTQTEALDYFTQSTEHGKTPKGTKVMPQRMELYKPKTEMFGKRQALAQWKVEGYRPDSMDFVYG